MERDHAAAVWSELGGYRLLRTIGRGEHCVAYLASGDSGQVVVKAYADDTEAARVANEVACLSGAASPHVVAVVDVSSAPDRPMCIVLERLSGRTLSDWLRDRTFLDTGEVVTAAVSVLRGIRAVHQAGWAHGNLAASSIRFDESGCPVLLGFGSAIPATPAEMTADWERCVTVLDAILSRAETIDPDEMERVRIPMGRLHAEGAAEAAAVDEAERALFALGPPAPLTMGTSSHPTTARSRGPHSAEATLGTPVGDAAPQTRTGREGLSQLTRGVPDEVPKTTAMARRVIGMLAHAMEHGVMAAVSGRLRRLLSGRSRPVLIGSCGAVTLTIVALLALPSTSAGHAEAPRSTPPARATTGAPSPVPSPVHPMSIPTNPGTLPTGDDDPVHAAFHLLQSRRSCLENGDNGCLTAVDQADSPLFAADRALIAGGQMGRPVPELDQLSLTETMGDVAVVSVAPTDETTKPASALLIKTEAGWRLRALFES
ncbi:hypothetical protein GCM10028798_10170 [Humibacter antri]